MELLMSTMKHKFAPSCNEVKRSSVFSVVIKIDNYKKIIIYVNVATKIKK